MTYDLYKFIILTAVNYSRGRKKDVTIPVSFSFIGQDNTKKDDIKTL